MAIGKATVVSTNSSLSLMNNHPHPNIHHHLEHTPELHSSDDSAKNSKNPSSWDPQDDILLRHLKEVRKMGWKDISQYFQNRTPNACQFRWRRLKSGNLKSNKTATLNINEYAIDISSIAKNEHQQQQQQPVASVPVAPAQPVIQVHAPGASPAQHPLNSPQVVPQVAQIHFNSNNKPTFSAAYTNTNLVSTPYSTIINTGAGSKFIKPRSMSHSLTRPNSNFMPPHTNNIPPVLPEQENIGFIPKIIVKSRRSSYAHPSNAPPLQQIMTPSSSNAFNLTLNSTKSRKNSFSTRSRRSSFNISSNSSSRRPSLVAAPSSISNLFGAAGSTTPPTAVRKESIVGIHHRGILPVGQMQQQQTINNSTFMDLPQHRVRSQNQQTLPRLGGSVSSQAILWSVDEDRMLLESAARQLSFTELSILLPTRSEAEIRWRISLLSNEQHSLSPSALSDSLKKSLYKPSEGDSIDDAIDENTFDEDEDDESANSRSDEDHEVFHQLQPQISSPSSKEISPVSMYYNNTDGSSNNSPSSLDARSASIISSSASSSMSSTANINQKLHNKQLPSINTILKDMM